MARQVHADESTSSPSVPLRLKQAAAAATVVPAAVIHMAAAAASWAAVLHLLDAGRPFVAAAVGGCLAAGAIGSAALVSLNTPVGSTPVYAALRDRNRALASVAVIASGGWVSLLDGVRVMADAVTADDVGAEEMKRRAGAVPSKRRWYAASVLKKARDACRGRWDALVDPSKLSPSRAVREAVCGAATTSNAPCLSNVAETEDPHSAQDETPSLAARCRARLLIAEAVVLRWYTAWLPQYCLALKGFYPHATAAVPCAAVLACVFWSSPVTEESTASLPTVSWTSWVLNAARDVTGAVATSLFAEGTVEARSRYTAVLTTAIAANVLSAVVAAAPCAAFVGASSLPAALLAATLPVLDLSSMIFALVCVSVWWQSPASFSALPMVVVGARIVTFAVAAVSAVGVFFGVMAYTRQRWPVSKSEMAATYAGALLCSGPAFCAAGAAGLSLIILYIERLPDANAALCTYLRGLRAVKPKDGGLLQVLQIVRAFANTVAGHSRIRSLQGPRARRGRTVLLDSSRRLAKFAASLCGMSDDPVHGPRFLHTPLALSPDVVSTRAPTILQVIQLAIRTNSITDEHQAGHAHPLDFLPTLGWKTQRVLRSGTVVYAASQALGLLLPALVFAASPHAATFSLAQRVVLTLWAVSAATAAGCAVWDWRGLVLAVLVRHAAPRPLTQVEGEWNETLNPSSAAAKTIARMLLPEASDVLPASILHDVVPRIVLRYVVTPFVPRRSVNVSEMSLSRCLAQEVMPPL